MCTNGGSLHVILDARALALYIVVYSHCECWCKRKSSLGHMHTVASLKDTPEAACSRQTNEFLRTVVQMALLRTGGFIVYRTGCNALERLMSSLCQLANARICRDQYVKPPLMTIANRQQ